LPFPTTSRSSIFRPYSLELNPENLWNEIREKIFQNYILKFMRAARAKLKQAILYIERNPRLVHFYHLRRPHCHLIEVVSDEPVVLTCEERKQRSNPVFLKKLHCFAPLTK